MKSIKQKLQPLHILKFQAKMNQNGIFCLRLLDNWLFWRIYPIAQQKTRVLKLIEEVTFLNVLWSFQVLFIKILFEHFVQGTKIFTVFSNYLQIIPLKLSLKLLTNNLRVTTIKRRVCCSSQVPSNLPFLDMITMGIIYTKFRVVDSMNTIKIGLLLMYKIKAYLHFICTPHNTFISSWEQNPVRTWSHFNVICSALKHSHKNKKHTHHFIFKALQDYIYRLNRIFRNMALVLSTL